MTFVVVFYTVVTILAFIGAICSCFMIGEARRNWSSGDCLCFWIAFILNLTCVYILWNHYK